ncbi:DUF305 domain-containing protein [Psychrobacter pygoscelis]|uniref:DUF305 domain-containing protein n=1 Tax=Psychrobacter pygoscelis TaxID=2488563 RepID=UPI001040122A|nr:DUF305 domain-containing protein [Psychrobacter pygoscelis]
MPPALYLLSVFSLCIAAATLSACQPTADSHHSTATTEAQSQTKTEPSLPSDQDDLAEQPPSNTSASKISEVQQHYNKAIAHMHEEVQLTFFINDVDVAFARGMLGHHRGAADLTKLEQRYGSDPSLRALASDIMTTEQVEIDALRKWLASHPDTRDVGPSTTKARQAYHYALQAMHQRMLAGTTAQNPDIIFAQTMLAHHRGAESMAKIQLKYGKNEEMRALAEQIIDEQLGEIEALRAWLATQGIKDNPRLIEPIAVEDEEGLLPADGTESVVDHAESLEGVTDTAAASEAS